VVLIVHRKVQRIAEHRRSELEADIVLGGVLEFPLRFPGQYFDAETGLFYNCFRNYDPQTGRHIQSDPIGLRGGSNTFLYARASPLRWIDPLGLLALCPRESRSQARGKRKRALAVARALGVLAPRVGIEPTTCGLQRLRAGLSHHPRHDPLGCRALSGAYRSGCSPPSLCTFPPTLVPFGGLGSGFFHAGHSLSSPDFHSQVSL